MVVFFQQILINKNATFKITDIYYAKSNYCRNSIEIKDLLLISNEFDDIIINKTYEFPIPTFEEIKDKMSLDTASFYGNVSVLNYLKE